MVFISFLFTLVFLFYLFPAACKISAQRCFDCNHMRYPSSFRGKLFGCDVASKINMLLSGNCQWDDLNILLVGTKLLYGELSCMHRARDRRRRRRRCCCRAIVFAQKTIVHTHCGCAVCSLLVEHEEKLCKIFSPDFKLKNNQITRYFILVGWQ